MVAGLPFQLVHAHILKLGYMVKNARKGQGNKSVDLVIYRPDGTPVPASLSGVHKGLTNAVRAIIALHPIDRGNLDDAALAADIAANGVTGQRVAIASIAEDAETEKQLDAMLRHMAYMTEAAGTEARNAYLRAILGRSRADRIAARMGNGATVLDAILATVPD